MGWGKAFVVKKSRFPSICPVTRVFEGFLRDAFTEIL